MGSSLYVVLETPVDSFDVGSVDGKALSSALNFEDEDSTLFPLLSFVSANVEETLEFLNDEGVDEVEIPEQQWFKASEGLNVIRAVSLNWQAESEKTASGNFAIEKTQNVTRDLEAIERILVKAQENNVCFHFAFDF